MVGKRRDVGIVTIYSMANYGNRLQNYAVHSILASRGYGARTLVLKRRYVQGAIADVARHIVGCCAWWRTESRRYRNFYRFNRLIPHARFLSHRHLEHSRDTYACFVVGSDQIWHPRYTRLGGRQFLDWAHDYQRIALAPSFGVAEVATDVRTDYAHGLDLFARLSVREDAGARLIRDLSGRSATVLIDPTLVLTADEWRTVARRSERPSCPYILTYFLGEVSPNRIAAIQAFAKSHSLAVIGLMDRSNPAIYTSGPSEFIDLIDNAACVFTDSFHGSVFSLLLKTPFTLFDREDGQASMSSRVDTFVRTFGLEHTLYSKSGLQNALSTDGYAEAYETLGTERMRFLEYLDNELTRVEASLTDSNS